MNRAELALLATIRGAQCPTQHELEAVVGQSAAKTLEQLEADGLVDRGHWLRFADRDLEETDDWRYIVSTQGEIALAVADGRTCDWCHRKAVEGRPLKRGATYIYFCRRHFDIGWESAGTELASNGSLHGLIVSGKIKPRQPDEVAA
ncbi:MAG TPA: helix-turn-helix domain-containing protein [Solirubrobacterales bacterium]|nr:helix-turn-helix domain-containing protein [Solirubrobacterales bacterium]